MSAIKKLFISLSLYFTVMAANAQTQNPPIIISPTGPVTCTTSCVYNGPCITVCN